MTNTFVLWGWGLSWAFQFFWFFFNRFFGNSLVVQWLGLCAFTNKGVGSILVWGTKIPPGKWVTLPPQKRSLLTIE